jgi:hypothetical protein
MLSDLIIVLFSEFENLTESSESRNLVLDINSLDVEFVLSILILFFYLYLTILVDECVIHYESKLL